MFFQLPHVFWLRHDAGFDGISIKLDYFRVLL